MAVQDGSGGGGGGSIATSGPCAPRPPAAHGPTSAQGDDVDMAGAIVREMLEDCQHRMEDLVRQELMLLSRRLAERLGPIAVTRVPTVVTTAPASPPAAGMPPQDARRDGDQPTAALPPWHGDATHPDNWDASLALGLDKPHALDLDNPPVFDNSPKTAPVIEAEKEEICTPDAIIVRMQQHEAPKVGHVEAAEEEVYAPDALILRMQQHEAPKVGHVEVDKTSCLVRLVESNAFVALSTLAILANTVFLGVDAEQKIQHELKRLNGEDPADIATYTEYCFTMFFIVELILLLSAQKSSFFCGPDKISNVFDAILIICSVIELILAFADASISVKLSVFRIFRILRLARLLKVIRRIPFLNSLKVMVDGIVMSFLPLMWAVLLLIGILYGFAVFFMSAIATYLVNALPNENDGLVADLSESYGTVLKVVTLLIEAVTGGNDWANLSLPLREISEGYYICFTLYIVFITFGILNIVTGFFVDGAIHSSNDIREELVEQAREKKVAATALLGELFQEMDSDGSSSLSFSELEDSLHTTNVQEIFCVLELSTNDAKELFNILDVKKTGYVSIEEFIGGCLRFVGGVSGGRNSTTLVLQSTRLLGLVEELREMAVEQRSQVQQQQQQQQQLTYVRHQTHGRDQLQKMQRGVHNGLPNRIMQGADVRACL
eukprot:NODE_1562_length_2437_cov_10.813420.p1 GENE.NODE_1562_length_2437_cov_10.813420~~NODE_1562_length_2437_cov_10.813420.p1  ORF type:complete len:719 (+),score=210.67 NODE_1562_length_2437_cov_10.813420:164-2158(+)